MSGQRGQQPQQSINIDDIPMEQLSQVGAPWFTVCTD